MKKMLIVPLIVLAGAALWWRSHTNDDDSSLSWYYLHRLGLLAAYDTKSRRLIGWMGPDGFSPGEARPRPFAGRLNSRSSRIDLPFLVFEDTVYRLDLDSRRVEKVFQRDSAEALVDAGSAHPSATTLANHGEGAQFEVPGQRRGKP